MMGSMKRKLPMALAGLLALAVWLGRPVGVLARGVSPEYLRQLTPQLQDGDLIFIRISNPIFRRVAETTDSWETHVGILFAGTNGTWQVAESTFPFSRFSPLERFVARSEKGRFCVIRYRGGLAPEEKLDLRLSAGLRMGIRYDLGFNYDSPRLYCSKFVRQVYQEATGYEVGRLETFRELLADNPRAPLGFWRAWYFGFIPWDRRCVTTTSQLNSPEFSLVFDSTDAHFPVRNGEFQR
jgi:hypothetical protein